MHPFIKLTVIVISISFQQSLTSIQTFELKIEKVTEIELTDTITPVYQHSSSNFAKSNHDFYLSSGNKISAYDLKSGTQNFVSDLTGEGPFEVENLYHISINKNDQGVTALGYNGKVVGLDKDGAPLYEFRIESVRNKNIIKLDSLFVVSNESPASEYFASVYNQKGQPKQAIDLTQQKENILLSAFKNGSTLQLFEDNIWITAPFNNKVLVFDSSSFERIKEHELAIPNFKGTPADQELPVYYQDMEEMNQFLQNNSIILNLYPFGDHFLVETMHMHDDFRKDLVLFDNNLKYQCHSTISTTLEGVEDPVTAFVEDELVYFYREEVHQDENDQIRKFLSGYSISCD